MSETAGLGLRALIIEPPGPGRAARALAIEERGLAVSLRDGISDLEHHDLLPPPDLLVLSVEDDRAKGLISALTRDLEHWPPVVVGLGEGHASASAAVGAGAQAFLETSATAKDLKQFLDSLAFRLLIRAHWKGLVHRLAPLERAVGTMQLGLTIANSDGAIIYANTAEERMHGYAPGELIGLPARSLSTPERTQTNSLHKQTPIRSWRRESINRRKDGTTFPVLLTSDLIFGPAGPLTAVVTVSEDITDRLQQEARFRSLSKAIETMQAGLTISDLEGRIVFVNPADARMHGYRPEELIGSDTHIYSGGLPGQLMGVEEIRAMRGWQREAVHVAKDGRHFPVRLLSDVVPGAHGEPVAMVTTCEDISERRRAEEQLLHAALHDDLTGLPNRALFLDRLGLALARIPRRPGYGFGVLFIDLDRFKVINDSMGHGAGDRCLIEVGQRLEACVRRPDTVSRLGGDEFAVLVDEVGSVEALTEAAGRIQCKLSEPMSIEGRTIFTSASIGIASTATGYTEPADILRDADNAMYRAKARGGAQAEVFDRSMHGVALKRLELENELRLALDAGEFELHYQPIIRLDSSQLADFEALIRWRHPRRGVVAPDEFIPVAEETGLIRPIGTWVIKETVRQIRSWNLDIRSPRPIRVSFNVSAVQFDQGNLVEEIRDTLRDADVAPTSLALEVTESLVLRNRVVTARILAELRALGVTIYLDDFGTGYSSLSLLHELPVDTLKIDKSFVGRIGEAGENSEIVQSVVGLGHGLGLVVLAEGIETAVQLAQLRALRCQYGQGWYFHPAVPAEEASRLLRFGLPSRNTGETPRSMPGTP